MLKFAITGNIASGKSLAESVISTYYPVYDSDKLAHDVLDTIDDFYGYEVFTDGKVDRKKLGALVFNNRDLRKKLEGIVHPLVKEKILEIFNENKEQQYVFVSVPLLYEAGFETLFDKVIFIRIDENIQLQRLITRNNLSKEDALLRINSQMPQEEKAKRADFVFDNNSSKKEFRNVILEFLNSLNK